MKYRILILMLLIMSLLHSKVVIDPNCKVTFGASDVYISGGLQMDIPKTEESNIDLTRKILGKDVKAIRGVSNDIPTKSETKNANITFDLNSRLYFIGDGDAELTNVYALYNTTVAKPSGNLIMNSDLDITGNLDFSSGNIITGANTLTLIPVLSATLTNETASAYVIGNVQASKLVATGTSTFGGIGFQINNTGNNLGTVTILRQSGAGNDVNIYGSNGIERKWTVGTSVAFSGTRSVTTSWPSNEDNGNTLTSLKAWKYEASKGDTKSDKDIDAPMIESDPKTLGWVEVDGASFNTASSPRTSTFIISSATSYTINDALCPFVDGSGTEANPYQIATLDQLNAVRSYLTACFIQIVDIDATPTSTWDSGSGWTPISNFGGKYDGDGYIVSNLFIDRSATDYIALFGSTAAGSEIKDMGLENIDITGNDYVAAFAGYNRGDILNCYSTGNIKPTGNFSGGFFGYTWTGSNIVNCYSNAIVTRMGGTDVTYIGGFGGMNFEGNVSNCYSTGSVHFDGATDPTNKGFLGTIDLSTNNNNFWNTETSEQATSLGATGKTTAEMQNVATYTNTATTGLTNPWDFVGNPNNDVANDDTWNIHISLNGGYPYFEYENRIPVLAPGNLALVYSAGDVILTWDAVTDAAGYAVYSSADPYGAFILDENGGFTGATEWTITTADSKMFYFVTATNATKETPKVISMSSKMTDR